MKIYKYNILIPINARNNILVEIGNYLSYIYDVHPNSNLLVFKLCDL